MPKANTAAEKPMYSLFLVLAVALVVLSPLALELFLTTIEHRRQQRKAQRFATLTKTHHPNLTWTPARPRW